MTVTGYDEHERTRWTGRADAYRRSFAQLCAFPAGALLDRVRLTSGMRLLDVGTGIGTVAALAGDRGASVTAVDPEPSMVAAARRAAPGAKVRIGGFPELPFGAGSFDAAVANFVVNHVGDPCAAVADMGRVVRPGGWVALTVWPSPPPPLQQLWNEVFAAAGFVARTDVPAPPRNFARTIDGLSGLLREAGLTAVVAETVTWTHRADPEDWWSGPANGLGTPGLLMDGAPASTVARIKQAYDRVSAAHLDAGGRLALPTAALLAAGTVSAE